MKTNKGTLKVSELRQLAEKELETAAGSSTDAFSEMSPEKMKALIYELQVHQIELQIQNEELRRIQGELEKTRDSYSHLYDFSPVGHVTLTEKGIIDEANLTLASMLGMERGALIGEPFTHFVVGEDQDTFYKLQHRLLETEESRTSELHLMKKDGHAFFVNLECMVLKDRGDDSRFIRGAVIDISERKRAEEKSRLYLGQLERSNKELQEFAFIASHDLQEPLRKIQSFGNLLITEFSDSISEEGRDFLVRMQDAAARMRVLIDSLLSYSRVSTRIRPFSKVDLREAVEEALTNLSILREETNGSVEVGGLPTVEGDKIQMTQLFQNLISNALKFHRKGESPRVKIHSRLVHEDRSDEGDIYEIRVEDDGIGFDEIYLSRIFSPFQRLHGKREYEGVGVGLAICLKIVERHHGRITAKSRPGSGAVFLVTLPEKIKVEMLDGAGPV